MSRLPTEQHAAPEPDQKVLRLIRRYDLEGVGDVEPLTDDVDRLYALLEGSVGTRSEQTAASRRLEWARIDDATLLEAVPATVAIRSRSPPTERSVRKRDSHTSVMGSGWAAGLFLSVTVCFSLDIWSPQ
ncbi:hypothetical protein [Natrinema amylolyticum]|uniref:hypothetical protein n=1 Tax=Natrinema amylolyticum TaxID=2878679 RepID=UPI001CF94E3D|nr:hypothetical protein [Natrinema amylolyticum]